MKRIHIIFVCLFSISLLGYACRESLRESWYIWRLGWSDPQVCDEAIDWLAENGTARAVPALLRMKYRGPLRTSLSATGGCWLRILSKPKRAVVQIGPSAIPSILRELRRVQGSEHPSCWDDSPSAPTLACLLVHMGAETLDPVLECARSKPSPACLAAAVHAINYHRNDNDYDLVTSNLAFLRSHVGFAETDELRQQFEYAIQRLEKLKKRHESGEYRRWLKKELRDIEEALGYEIDVDSLLRPAAKSR
ncbi:MAG: hypothetical protein AAF517_20110 [Planctomycetota bacterium]